MDERQKAFVRNIAENPVWKEILNEIESLCSLPVYKKGKGEDQVSDWIYESGKSDMKEVVLKMLRGN
jgi:hypothetical protein